MWEATKKQHQAPPGLKSSDGCLLDTGLTKGKKKKQGYQQPSAPPPPLQERVTPVPTRKTRVGVTWFSNI